MNLSHFSFFMYNLYKGGFSWISIIFKIFSIIFTFTIVFTTSFCYALGPSSNVIYDGIDISAWQEGVDFEQVKNAGYDVVYIKASQGTDYIDPYFKSYYNEAKILACR